MGIGGCAIAHPPDNALQNTGQTEHIIGDIEIHVFNAVAPRGIAIKAGIFIGIGNVERVEIAAQKRIGAAGIATHIPLHQMIGEIAERMTQR